VINQKVKDASRPVLDALKALRRAYRFFVPVRAENPIETEIRTIGTEIRKALGKKTSVFFVQVGSNDGVRHDPLHALIVNNQNWTGMFIEPLQQIFQRLQQNYRFSDRFIFENVAIGTKNEARQFYYISDDAKELGESVSSWFDQLGSFNKAHVLKHCTGRNSPLESYISQQEIKCISCKTFLTNME